MRKKYNEYNNTQIGNYFTKLIVRKYILPSILVLTFVFMCFMLVLDRLSATLTDFQPVDFIYLICLNVLVSIASTSIYHTIRTCLFGYKQISNKQYVVLQLNCLEKSKGIIKDTCVLSDNNEYVLYDRKQYDEIEVNKTCDLIIVSNEYGAKLWEIVVKSREN